MKTITSTLLACILSAVPALGLVTGGRMEPGLLARDTTTPDLGDGFYVFQYDDSGAMTNYTFTPVAQLDFTGYDDDNADLSERGFHIEKRSGTSCAKTYGKEGPISKAKFCLRTNAGGQHYTKHTSAQCIVEDEKAYLCNYQAQTVTHAEIHTLQVTVDAQCGVLKNGFTRCTNDCGVNDLAVGRAKKTAPICGF